MHFKDAMTRDFGEGEGGGGRARLLFIRCLTSQRHACASQGRI